VDLRFSVGVEGRLGHFAVGLGGTNVYPADSDCVGNLAEGGTCLPPAPELDLQFGMGGRRRPGFTVRLNAVHFPVYAAGTPPLFENGPDYWLTAVAQGDLVARIGDRQGGLWNLRLSLISKRMANFAVGIDAPMPGGGRGYTALLLGGFAASPVHPGGRGLATGFEFGASFGDPGRAPVSGAPGISLERAFVSVAVDRFVPVVVDAEVRVGGPAWAVAMHGLQVDILGSPTDARQRLLALTVGPQSRWWAFGLGAGASEWRDQSQPTLAAQWRLGRVDATRLYTWFDVAFSTYCAEDRSSQGCPASPVAKPTALSLTLNIPVHPRWELVEALSSNEAALVTLRSGVDFRVHGGNVPVWFGLGLGLERGVPGLNASLRYGG
jgi:hypothetical protein